MWQKIADMTKTLFNFGETLSQNRADIKDLQREVRQLSTAVQLLAQELHHVRENEAHEREKMALRLENTLLKQGRQLSAPKNEDAE